MKRCILNLFYSWKEKVFYLSISLSYTEKYYLHFFNNEVKNNYTSYFRLLKTYIWNNLSKDNT